MKSRDRLRIGSGAGTSDDRMVPALELAERGDIDYLVFECLAERTVSRENLARSKDPELGYSPSLHARLRMVLPTCIAKGIRIVSNMGAANPLGGARAARKEAADLGLGDVPVALVLGFILWSGFAPKWLGRLPGDIRIEREHGTFYFPIVTCIIASVVLSLLFSLFRR